MRLVIQKVNYAQVSVGDKIVGKINKGFLVFVGIGQNDTREIADKYIHKMIGLRIFEDDTGKSNLSLTDVGGQVLLISQFTLYANCRKGNRPSFIEAGDPRKAEELYEYIIEKAKQYIPIVERGIFGAHMNVALENNGPFTIVLDEKLFQ